MKTHKKNLLTWSAAVALSMAAFLPLQPAVSATLSTANQVGSYVKVVGDSALSSISSLKNSIENGELNVQTDSENFAWNRAYVGELDGKKVVTVPLLNVGDSWSNFTVYYSDNGLIEDYTEGHFKQLSADSGSVKIFLNGKLETDGVFHDSDAANSSAQVNSGAVAFGLRDAIAELNSCLASAGIPAWLVAGAAALCSTTGWVGILACYTGAGIAGGTVGYCVGKAQQKL